VSTGKRIGFVDLKLENFHANVYLKAVRNELQERGFLVAGCFALDEADGRAWAAKNAVPYFADAAELDRNVDCYAVLAPSNPEVHLDLCRRVLPFGKPTYVDKTFAPDLATARRIFALADRFGVALQTSSALRYTNVQTAVRTAGAEPLRHMVTWGGGRSFDEYAIHPVELAVSCLGPAALSLMRRGTGDQSQLLINFSGDRTAVVNVYTNANTAFAASLTTGKGTTYVPVDGSRMFINMAAAILDLFESRTPNIDRQESLMIRRILDVAGKPAAQRRFVQL